MDLFRNMGELQKDKKKKMRQNNTDLLSISIETNDEKIMKKELKENY